MSEADKGPANEERKVEDLLARALEIRDQSGALACERFVDELGPYADRLRRHLRLLDVVEDYTVHDAEAQLPEAPPGYRLLRFLGRGTLGDVYSAESPEKKRVAVKILHPWLIADEGARSRLRNESDAVNRLDHPNALAWHASEDGSRPCLVTELLDGTTLADAMHLVSSAGRPFTIESFIAAAFGTANIDVEEAEIRRVAAAFGVGWPNAAARLCAMAARGIAHAHSRGILHRDVKPSNLVLTVSGKVVVIDFGLAHTSGQERMSSTGVAIGTPAYSPPEVLRAAKVEPDVFADIWAIGVTLYELLAARHPFVGETFATTMKNLVEADPIPLKALAPEVPGDLRAIVEKAMAVDPQRRYATADALAEDLEAYCEGRSVRARAASPADSMRRFARRHPARATLVAILIPTTLTMIGLEMLSAATVRAERDQKTRALERSTELVDLAAAKDLMARFETLWPAAPARVRGSRGMDAWIAECRGLLEKSESVTSAWRALRATLTADAEPGSWEHARRGEIDVRLTEIETDLEFVRKNMAVGREWREEILARERRPLERERLLLGMPAALATRARTIAESSDIFDDLRAALAEVIARRDRAYAIESESRIDSNGLWQKTIAEIADRSQSPIYGGLRIAPQFGLFPLGKDPATGLFEFAHLASGEPAHRDPTTGLLKYKDTSGIVLVLLPGGPVTIGAHQVDAAHPEGSPRTDVDAHKQDSSPTDHNVAPFFIAKHETTEAQWLHGVRVLGATPRTLLSVTEPPDPRGPRIPAVAFTWIEWMEMARRIGLTLPTEAQWEYAARGGVDTTWTIGNDPRLLARAANGGDRSFAIHRNLPPYESVYRTLDDGFPELAPVGSYEPNRFGLFDVQGNVREWCLDGLGPLSEPPIDAATGRRWVRPEGPRATRGGSWAEEEKNLRLSARGALHQDARESDHGVRFARAIE